MAMTGHVDVHVAQYKDSFTIGITYIRPEIFCRQKKFSSPPIGKERTIIKKILILWVQKQKKLQK